MLKYFPLTKMGSLISYKFIYHFNRIQNISRLKRQKVFFKLNFQINGRIYIQNNGTIKIGNNFSANSGINFNPIGGDNILRLITYTSQAMLIIGNNVGISNSTIVCWNKIEISDNVIIGGGVKIWDTNFHSLRSDIRLSGNDNDIKTAPIYIGENSFIGGSSIILKGITIGKNSIIAAGSVVTKDIPDNVIAGGNPCVIIKHL